MVFSVWLGWFPLGFSVPLGKSAADVTLLDTAHHIVLPAIVLSFVGVANIALHTREKLVDILESDYVKFARARGLSTWQIVRRHGMRNLLLPAMTLQFASISEIFGGSVLVEQVFFVSRLGPGGDYGWSRRRCASSGGHRRGFRHACVWRKFDGEYSLRGS